MNGQTLGSFRIGDLLGSGAMGEVFHATQTLKNGQTRKAAVKIISSDFALRDNSLARFQLEAEILAQLRHPNIVRYYAHGRTKGTWYYAMEFVEGMTLDQLLEKREILPWREVVDLSIQLCDALHYAHQHQVVHRDLKPSNLMITVDGHLKLTDFGIAKDLEATEALTKTGRTLGTAAYMAPEQIKGTPAVSHKTDLYALGCLMYEMLTGKTPFTGKSAVVLMHAHMSEPPPRPSSKNPDVPRELDDLVLRLMAKDPGDRPWDAQQVCTQLEQLRDRAEAGEPIEMVYDRARAKVAAEKTLTGPRTLGTESGLRGERKTGSRSRGGGEGFGVNRRVIETSLLALVFVSLTAFVVYRFLPESQEALYEHAVEAMKSPRRADWRKAEKEYMAALDRRFPEHPYKDQLAKWRDQIVLNDARERAVRLESSGGLGSRPLNFAEELYQSTEREVRPLIEKEMPGPATSIWQRYITELETRNDPDERGWLLLGQEKLHDLRGLVESRRDSIGRQLNEAVRLAQEGDSRAALALLKQLETSRSLGNDPAVSDLMGEVEQLIKRITEGPPEGAEPPDVESKPPGSTPQPGDRNSRFPSGGPGRSGG